MGLYLMATCHFDKGTLGDAGQRSQTSRHGNSVGARRIECFRKNHEWEVRGCRGERQTNG